MPITIIDHPLIQHKLTILRDRDTGVKEFRKVVGEIAMLMCYETTRDLPLEEVGVETPVAPARGRIIAGKKPVIVPVMRAGLGMVNALLRLIPAAKVAHIGLYRDPGTLLPVEYYCKVPPDIAERDCILLDPMLATGGTASAAAQVLKNFGARSIRLLCILGSPPGLDKMQSDHPDVNVYVCAIDPELDENAYIVPGLGDAGDRIFGTR
ncbi:MAG: uracil phosphoribosyltransferase [Oscillospiraceae bacterium]|nr:uracil phosphoribosyltransferase [Oscillospiraceae bacterium]